MATPQAPQLPQGQKVLPLSDPYMVQEIFANELTGVQVRDGHCHFTFSVVRPRHSMQTDGAVHNDPDVERIVSIRYVVPLGVVNAMGETLRQLSVALKQDQSAKKPN